MIVQSLSASGERAPTRVRATAKGANFKFLLPDLSPDLAISLAHKRARTHAHTHSLSLSLSLPIFRLHYYYYSH